MKWRPFDALGEPKPTNFMKKTCEQDGALFDSKGCEIGEGWKPAEPVVTVEPPPEKKAGPSPDEVVALAKAGKTPVEIGRTLGVHVAKVKAIIKRAL